MPQIQDRQIIEYIRSGDPELQNTALKQVYLHNYQSVKKFIINHSGFEADATDLFQDGIIVLFNQILKPGFEFQSKISNYLFGICKNLWYSRLRNKKNNFTDNSKVLRVIQTDEERYQTLEESDQKRIISELMHSLDKDCQKIIEYYYYRKMRMQEIRQKMDYASEQVAKNKKSRCMKSLRTKVMQNDHYKESLR